MRSQGVGHTLVIEQQNNNYLSRLWRWRNEVYLTIKQKCGIQIQIADRHYSTPSITSTPNLCTIPPLSVSYYHLTGWLWRLQPIHVNTRLMTKRSWKVVPLIIKQRNENILNLGLLSVAQKVLLCGSSILRAAGNLTPGQILSLTHHASMSHKTL